MFICPYCEKSDIRTRGGLTQHLEKSAACRDQYHTELTRTARPHSAPTPRISRPRPPVPPSPPAPPPKKRATIEDEKDEDSSIEKEHDEDALPPKVGAVLDFGDALEDEEEDVRGDDDNENDDENQDNENDDEDPAFGFEPLDPDDDDEDSGPNFPGPLDPGGEADIIVGPNTTIRDQFLQYLAELPKNILPLSKDEVRAVRLLDALRMKKTPLNAYPSIMEWHLKESGELGDLETLKDSLHYIGRETLFKTLEKRYNMTNKHPFQKKIKLPVSGSVVNITCNTTTSVFQQLLTDPRMKDADYMFFDDDPLASPPETFTYLRDLNTGRAFRDTYKALIDPSKREQLLPVVMYIDGAAISHFHNMELIQVRISLGFWNRKAREKQYAWATLGYVEKVHESGGKGLDIIQESHHVEVQDDLGSSDESNEAEVMEGVGEKNDQDLHAMLKFIFTGLVDLQETGFIWDLSYKGKTYKDMIFKIFIPFVKADTTEADKLAGKYGIRHNVHQICRYCHIPLDRADDHLGKYKFKTVHEIRNLVSKEDMKGLQAISQTYLLNAFYDLRFSLGNDRGIHGYCPMEMLHALYLGIFKYVRDIFFAFMGTTGETGKAINAFTKQYGRYFSRQSDRTMPKTGFSKGIKEGKLMAKEYRGVLLLMLAILRSTKGRDLLTSARLASFRETTAKDDWILVVEVLLELDVFLNQEEMKMSHVR